MAHLGQTTRTQRSLEAVKPVRQPDALRLGYIWRDRVANTGAQIFTCDKRLPDPRVSRARTHGCQPRCRLTTIVLVAIHDQIGFKTVRHMGKPLPSARSILGRPGPKIDVLLLRDRVNLRQFLISEVEVPDRPHAVHHLFRL